MWPASKTSTFGNPSPHDLTFSFLSGLFGSVHDVHDHRTACDAPKIPHAMKREIVCRALDQALVAAMAYHERGGWAGWESIR